MKKQIRTYAVFFLLSYGLAGFGSNSSINNRHDWPQWRGINRDAVSLETGLIETFPKGGPEILWHKKIGEGYSNVVVSEGKLYTMWDEEKAQFLFCLDALTGKELWRQKLGAAFSHHYGNGPRSSPLIDGEAVFAVGTQGRLFAVNKETGELLWKHDLVKAYGARLPSYGYVSSPLVIDDRLVIEVGGKKTAYIAFAKKNGQVIWASKGDSLAYCSPIDISINGVEQIVFWSANGLQAVSLDNGDHLWKYAWETFCPVTGVPLNTCTPIFIATDKIFLSSGTGAAVIRIAGEGKKFEVQTVWKSEKMKNDVNTSVLFEQHVYGFDGGILKCLDVATGEVKWRARGFRRGSLIAADGQLIVLGERGKLALIAANPNEFVEKASAQILNGKCWTSPTLAWGKLYLRNQKELVCLNMEE